MAAHKYASMIKAKADNMDLAVLSKHYEGEWVEASNQEEIAIKQNGNYFLCLPRHKEACLHWLNGGDVKGKNYGHWVSFTLPKPIYWNLCTAFMDATWEIKIKPRKEKRWVAVNNYGHATPMTFISKQECESYVSVSYQKCPGVTWQPIEIEVEV